MGGEEIYTAILSDGPFTTTLAPPPSTSNEEGASRKKKILIACGVVVGLVLLIVTPIIMVKHRRHKRRSRGKMMRGLNAVDSSEGMDFLGWVPNAFLDKENLHDSATKQATATWKKVLDERSDSMN